MKIDSRISKQKEKEQCHFRDGWKDNNPWASKGWQRVYISEPFSALDLTNLNWVASVCCLQINGWGFMSSGATFHEPLALRVEIIKCKYREKWFSDLL